MHLIEYFDRGALINPDRSVFIYEGEELSYRDARVQNLRIANGLRSLGLEIGDKCAVLSRNHPRAFNAMLGALRAGGIWIPINSENALQSHIDLMELLQCEFLMFSKHYEDLMPALKAVLPHLKGAICTDGDSVHGPSLDAVMATAATDEIVLPHDDDRITAIPSTGGTTGKPKGVMQSNRTWDCFVANMLATLTFDADSVYLAAAPMTHAAGAYAFPVLAVGGTLLFHNGVNPERFIGDIETYRVTETFLPPTATLAVLAHPDARTADFSSLRSYISTGAPMAPDRAREVFNVLGPVWVQLYGQTEALCIMSVLTPRDCVDDDGNLIPERFETVGRCAPFNRMAIMDGDGNLLPPSEKGEIVVQSNLVMIGYYDNPEATAEVSSHGWHHTGDVGAFDENGYLRILDRTKDMIITGGLNVYPSEIENHLMGHPAIHEVAVIGVPDEKWGEAVKAVVQLKPDAQPDESGLISYCKAHLGSVKTPKSVDFVDSFPKSAVGKLLKKELRAKYWEGVDRQI